MSKVCVRERGEEGADYTCCSQTLSPLSLYNENKNCLRFWGLSVREIADVSPPLIFLSPLRRIRFDGACRVHREPIRSIQTPKNLLINSIPPLRELTFSFIITLDWFSLSAFRSGIMSAMLLISNSFHIMLRHKIFRCICIRVYGLLD